MPKEPSREEPSRAEPSRYGMFGKRKRGSDDVVTETTLIEVLAEVDVFRETAKRMRARINKPEHQEAEAALNACVKGIQNAISQPQYTSGLSEEPGAPSLK